LLRNEHLLERRGSGVEFKTVGDVERAVGVEHERSHQRLQRRVVVGARHVDGYSFRAAAVEAVNLHCAAILPAGRLLSFIDERNRMTQRTALYDFVSLRPERLAGVRRRTGIGEKQSAVAAVQEAADVVVVVWEVILPGERRERYRMRRISFHAQLRETEFRQVVIEEVGLAGFLPVVKYEASPAVD